MTGFRARGHVHDMAGCEPVTLHGDGAPRAGIRLDSRSAQGAGSAHTGEALHGAEEEIEEAGSLLPSCVPYFGMQAKAGFSGLPESGGEKSEARRGRFLAA